MATKTQKKYKTIEHYLKLPWTYVIKSAGEGKQKYYIICVEELPGVCTDGKTFEEALESIKDAMAGTLELYMKNNEDIPLPLNEEDFPGEISYHTTSKRHYLLKQEAQRRRTSVDKVLDECVDIILLK